MKKNINYMIGLISVIGICALINGFQSNKEGYAEKSCVDLNSSTVYFKDNLIDVLKSIMEGGIDETNYSMVFKKEDVGPVVSITVQHLVNIDKFTAFLKSSPNFFTDLFNNQSLQDPDFIVIYNFYNSFNFALHTVRMILIKVNSNLPYKGSKKIPICNLQPIDVKSMNDSYNKQAKVIVNSMKKVLDNINKTKNVPPDLEVSDSFVNVMTDTYGAIMDINKCSQYVFKSFQPQQLDVIFPFLDLIRMYCSNFSTLMAKHVVIPLNYKLKNGQIRIKPEAPKPPTNDGASSVPTSSALVSPTGTLANTNALFIGPGATYA